MINNIENRLRVLESWMHDSAYDTRHQIRSENYKRYREDIQPSSVPYMFTAMTVNTLDPMAEGQVQYYTPHCTLPGTDVNDLPWAYPVSPFGGFDDCGVTWIPPAGSKLVLFYENGDPNQAYYFGTVWPSTRGIKAGGNSSEEQGDSQLPSEDESRSDMWDCEIPEYDCIWEGERDGYNLGPNDGSQVKQPWNTDNVQTKDWDTQEDFDPNPESNQFMTYPHQYGFKTPGKHYVKMHDGDHRCNHRYAHFEIATGRCNIIMLKDDHLHPAAQWAFNGMQDNNSEIQDDGSSNDPNQANSDNQSQDNQQQQGNTMMTADLSKCHSPMESFTDCTDPNESTDCQDEDNPEDPQQGQDQASQDQQNQQQSDSQQSGPAGQSNASSKSNSSIQKDEFTNPYYKREEEMRFYKAPDSLAQYQNPKCELKQSGIQIQSVSGMQFVMDDSVDQPQGEPNWKLDFDWGCNDVFKGKMFMRTTTGHYIGANDEEDDTLIRSENNGIRIQTATGNKIELLDHTLGDKEAPEEAGEKRGIFIKSTSRHVLEFHDEGNKQFSLPRREPPTPEEIAQQQDQQGGQSADNNFTQTDTTSSDTGNDEDEDPTDITLNAADKAFILLRSGYGLQIRMDDAHSQTETDQQYLQILAPQISNEERGPHMMVFQEQPEGPGFVILRAGGIYYRSSFDDAIEVVGDEENPEPSNKFVTVTGNYIVDAEEVYFNHNDLTIFQAEKYIILFAGRDCPMPNQPDQAGQQAHQSAIDNAQAAAQGGEPLDKGPCIFPVVVGKDPWVCPMFGFVHYGIMPDPADESHTKLLNNSLSDRVFASASQPQEQQNQEQQGGENAQ